MRLVFVQNQGFVQTEARLIPAPHRQWELYSLAGSRDYQ